MLSSQGTKDRQRMLHACGQPMHSNPLGLTWQGGQSADSAASVPCQEMIWPSGQPFPSAQLHHRWHSMPRHACSRRWLRLMKQPDSGEYTLMSSVLSCR